MLCVSIGMEDCCCQYCYFGGKPRQVEEVVAVENVKLANLQHMRLHRPSRLPSTWSTAQCKLWVLYIGNKPCHGHDCLAYEADEWNSAGQEKLMIVCTSQRRAMPCPKMHPIPHSATAVMPRMIKPQPAQPVYEGQPAFALRFSPLFRAFPTQYLPVLAVPPSRGPVLLAISICLEVVLTHGLVSSVPMHTSDALVRKFLTWIVVF
jgi:hypothetical protein